MPLVARKVLWGDERVTVEMPNGGLRSIPAGWTDAEPADPYVSVAGGRSLFRFEDLNELVQLVSAHQKPKGATREQPEGGVNGIPSDVSK